MPTRPQQPVSRCWWQCTWVSTGLLYGVLQDARGPLGTQLSRRSRKQLAPPGFTPGRPTPYVFSFKPGLDLDQLAADLRGSGLTMSGHVLAVRRVINVVG